MRYAYAALAAIAATLAACGGAALAAGVAYWPLLALCVALLATGATLAAAGAIWPRLWRK